MPQKKKKILFVITQAEFGGAQRFLLELATHLDPAVFNIVVASQPGELLEMLGARGIAIKPLVWLTRNISPLRDMLAVREIYRLLKHEKPDTLFLLSSKAGFLGSLAARIMKHELGIKKSLEKLFPNKTVLHASYFILPKVAYRIGGWAFNDPQSWFSRALYLWTEKISARWKDIIVTNSKHDTEQAKRLGITPRKKLITIYNGLDVASLNFFPREHALKKLFEATGFKFQVLSFKLIGCIANFYKTKGLQFLVEAASILRKKNPHVKFVIIGDGGERRNIESRIMNHELEDTVFLSGQLRDAWRYLKAFDVFILPSLKEGFPWVVLEAMAAGVPIVATRVGALPEIIESGKNGLLVEPGNATQIATAIETLLENKLLRDSLITEARKTVEQRFTLDKMLKEVTELL